MKKRLKKLYGRLAPPLGWTALGVLVFLGAGAALDRQDAVVCKSIEVSIDTSTGLKFVTEKEILALMVAAGAEVIGKPAAMIDLQSVEDVLFSNPYIADGQAYMNALGELRIDVIHRQPVLLVINRDGVSYYLDENGKPLPASANFTARVPVATGHIDKRTREGLVILAGFLRMHPAYNRLVQQVVAHPGGEFELVPQLGNHTVLIGAAEGLNEKFEKLMTFYKEGLNNTGWYKYKTVNLKYRDQVVCTKY